nr:uncharacterized protein LOC113807327 [Penaeus vannamei]
MGLVNQLSELTPSIAATAQTLRPLLSPKHTFIWTADHNEAFRRVKEALSQPPVLAHFNPSLPIVLQIDAMTLRYATIELEMLAAIWATAKCKPYLIGVLNFTLMTDHRPLIPILNKYTLDTGHISPYQFTAVWRAGKQLHIPDAQSRAPVSRPTSEDENLCNDAATHLRSIVTCNTIGTVTDPKTQDADRTLQELREAASVNPEYARLKDCMSTGFPSNRYDLHKSLLPYWKIRDSLSADGELVLYGQRIIIPTAYRRRTLTQLHASHRGVEATKRRARQTVFWPGIDADIKSTVEA